MLILKLLFALSLANSDIKNARIVCSLLSINIMHPT